MERLQKAQCQTLESIVFPALQLVRLGIRTPAYWIPKSPCRSRPSLSLKNSKSQIFFTKSLGFWLILGKTISWSRVFLAVSLIDNLEVVHQSCAQDPAFPVVLQPLATKMIFTSRFEQRAVCLTILLQIRTSKVTLIGSPFLKWGFWIFASYCWHFLEPTRSNPQAHCPADRGHGSDEPHLQGDGTGGAHCNLNLQNLEQMKRWMW